MPVGRLIYVQYISEYCYTGYKQGWRWRAFVHPVLSLVRSGVKRAYVGRSWRWDRQGYGVLYWCADQTGLSRICGRTGLRSWQLYCV